MASNYENGKIYRIVCPDGHFYIGSTITSLSVRFNGHKQISKVRNSNIYTHIKTIGWDGVTIELIEDYPCDSKDELLIREDFYIRRYRNNPKCLNEKRGFVTPEEHAERKKQYYEEHKEEIIQSHREYTEANREYVDAYQAFYRLENAEKRRAYSKKYAEEHPEEKKASRRQHYQANKERIHEQCKAYSEIHKDEIREYKREWERKKRESEAPKREKRVIARKEKSAARIAHDNEIVTCECGGTYQNYRKKRHDTSKKHMKFLESQGMTSNPESDMTEVQSPPVPQNEVIEPAPITKRRRKIKIVEE